ncbi:MAG: M24 family metallopeptidase [Holosporales bacterium]|jgi:ribosome-associated GTPase EngA|nr:M24 family metallopeptidase [Holosporales bacterium]
MSQKKEKIHIICHFELQNALCGNGNSESVLAQSGFTGSSALLVIGDSKKAIFVDSRYTIQAQKECPNFNVIECSSLTFKNEKIRQWILDNFGGTSQILYSAKEVSHSYFEQMKEAFPDAEIIGSFGEPTEFKFLEGGYRVQEPSVLNIHEHLSTETTNQKLDSESLIAESDKAQGIWKIEEYPYQYAGQTFANKKNAFIKKITEDLLPKNQWAFLITSPESIAWLFNLRVQGKTKNCSPTFPSAALLSQERTFLLIPENSINFDLEDFKKVTFFQKNPIFFEETLKNIIEKQENITIFYNEKQISQSFFDTLEKGNCKLISAKDYCMELRGEKNEIEIENAKKIHKIEAVAIIRLFVWIKEQANITKVKEYDILEKLEEFREQSTCYKGPSFHSIIAYGANAAIVHYCPTKEKSSSVNTDNVLLLDVGGHYLGGTTDMTRTIWISSKTKENDNSNNNYCEVPAEIREAYTNVLKGHIALAMATFPQGTAGNQLDILAKQFLWKNQKNYSHGTGHGVGNYLAVHEGPFTISPYNNFGFKRGFFVSNEPGFYKKDHFGIRLENMMVSEDLAAIMDNSSLEGTDFKNRLLLKPFSSSKVEGAYEATNKFAEEIESNENTTNLPVINLAIIGRPNVGKSTLTNTLLGRNAQIVSNISGITRDTIDFDWEYAGRQFKLSDTAGIRRRAKIDDYLEKISVSKALETIDFASVCVLVVDATELEKTDYGDLLNQDLNLASKTIEEGRCVIVALNKFDLIKKRTELKKKVVQTAQNVLSQVPNVPIISISAASGYGVKELLESVIFTEKTWNKRIPTAKLNSWLKEFTGKNPPPASSTFRAKLKYITQINIRPPSFVVFCTRAESIINSYQKFLINQLRQAFKLDGVPIRLHFRKQKNPYK